MGFSALGQTLGVALAGIESEAPGAGPAPQDRHGNDDAAPHEPSQDAPDLGDADRPSLALEESGDLALAPHRVVGADGFDRLDQGGRPLGLSDAAWADASAARGTSPIGKALSEARPPPAPPARRSARRHGPPPAGHRVASSLRFDTGGLRCEKTRRGTAVPDNLPGQATNLHGGLLRLVDSQLSASETPFSFSITPSHICLNPDRSVGFRPSTTLAPSEALKSEAGSSQASP